MDDNSVVVIGDGSDDSEAGSDLADMLLDSDWDVFRVYPSVAIPCVSGIPTDGYTRRLLEPLSASDDEEACPHQSRPSSSSAAGSRTAPALAVCQGDRSAAVAVEDDGGGAIDLGQASSSAMPANTTPVRLIHIGDGKFAVANGNQQPGEEVPLPSPSASYMESPLRYWSLRIGGRMVETVKDVEGYAEYLRWCLPPIPGQSIVMWARSHIIDTLAQGSVKAFYIGITHQCAKRWWRTDYGHNLAGWHRMNLVAVSDLSDEIAGAEETLLEEFRHYGYRGKFLGPREFAGRVVLGHSLCTNRRPGGGGLLDGDPPHVLYVLWEWSR